MAHFFFRYFCVFCWLIDDDSLSCNWSVNPNHPASSVFTAQTNQTMIQSDIYRDHLFWSVQILICGPRYLWHLLFWFWPNWKVQRSKPNKAGAKAPYKVTFNTLPEQSFQLCQFHEKMTPNMMWIPGMIFNHLPYNNHCCILKAFADEIYCLSGNIFWLKKGWIFQILNREANVTNGHLSIQITGPVLQKNPTGFVQFGLKWWNFV